MRNLKRALSLALASVMLLGMMVVGTSATSANGFTDADEIVNKEAVAIATGLGIFDGYTDGSFGPDKVVTRAEMAVVIAKILHGADVDPSNFAGVGKFTDVPAWAEGYVNLVASLGIIEGYGNGKFGPNDTVTTVQATTMLLKALGYFVDDETALGADWQLSVTSKATALGLYGDKTLAMNAGLTRENVAELTFNALFAQRVAYDDYRGLYVKANDRNVVVTNGTEDDLNTLADNTFGLYSVEGIVTANGMTDKKLSASLKSEAQTTVVFTEDTDLDQNGKAEYAENESYDFEVETGLDMIGHAAKVYYKLVKDAPVVFAIVDQATLVAEISNNKNTTKLAAAANDAGFKKNSILDVKAANFIVNYDMTRTVADLTTWANGDAITLYTNATDDTQTMNTSKKLVVISNSTNKEVDYVIVLDQYLDVVADVQEVKGEIEYDLSDDATDMVIASEALTEDQFVIVTSIGNRDKVMIAEPAEIVSAEITKIIGKSTATSQTTGVVADGETYSESKVAYAPTATELDDTTKFTDITKIGAVSLILDLDGKLIALADEPTVPNYAYVAQYGYYYGRTANSVMPQDVLTALVYFADGTSGVYDVDLDDSDLRYSDAALDTDAWLGATSSDTVVDALNGAAAVNFTAYKGIWNVVLQADNTVRIEAPVNGEILLHDGVGGNAADDANTQLVKGHSTLVDGSGNNVAYSGSKILNNKDTVYFYVNGTYDATESDNGLSVAVLTGIKNAKSFKNNDPAGAGIKNVWMDTENGRNVYAVMGIDGIAVGGADGVYYYDTSKFEVEKVEGGYVVTYTLYDVNGDVKTVTYNNDGKFFKTSALAYDHAKGNPDGFYKIGTKNLENYVNVEVTGISTQDTDGVTGLTTGDTAWKLMANNEVMYVVNAVTGWDEYEENLFDNATVVGHISETAKFIDLTDNGLTSLATIKSELKKNSSITVSYRYNVEDYVADVVYVTGYAPDGTEAPGAGSVVAAPYKMTNMVVNAAGVIGVNLDANHEANEKFTVTLYTWSQEQGKWAVQSTKTITDPTADNIIGDGTTGFAMTNNVTYKIAVNGVEFNEFKWAGASVTVTPAL